MTQDESELLHPVYMILCTLIKTTVFPSATWVGFVVRTLDHAVVWRNPFITGYERLEPPTSRFGQACASTNLSYAQEQLRKW